MSYAKKRPDAERFRFSDHTTTDELQRMHDTLTDEVQDIQAQLAGDGEGIKDENGFEIEYDTPDFWSWRRRAIRAMTHKNRIKRKIRQAIKETHLKPRPIEHFESTGGVLCPSDVHGVLAAVVRAYMRLAHTVDAGRSGLSLPADDAAVHMARKMCEKRGLSVRFESLDAARSAREGE